MSVFEDFDAYCEANNITDEEAPMAFAAFLYLRTGWDGEAKPVSAEIENGGEE